MNWDFSDDDLVPFRGRSGTWPLQRPSLDFANTSPLIHERIKEEGSEEDESAGSRDNLQTFTSLDGPEPPLPADLASLDVAPCDTNFGVNYYPSQTNGQPPTTQDDASLTSAATNKKSNARKNAWGNLSYADLITQAISMSPEKRLTLSQIYDWMIHNVPYFRDKGDSNSSAGWKVGFLFYFIFCFLESGWMFCSHA